MSTSPEFIMRNGLIFCCFGAFVLFMPEFVRSGTLPAQAQEQIGKNLAALENVACTFDIEINNTPDESAVKELQKQPGVIVNIGKTRLLGTYKRLHAMAWYEEKD